MTEQSPVERIKRESRHLRGTLAESLADPLTGAIREDDTVLIKFHGSYQQDDRDIRDERRRQKLEPAYSFMIRTRLPGGVCTPAQWLQLDAIARTLRQRHAAHHDAPGLPVPRRDQDRAQDDDAGDQRRADRHARGLRRRQPQRDGERQPGRDARARGGLRLGQEAVGAPAAEARAPTTRSGSTARRSSARQRKSSRSTAPTYLPRKFKAAIVVPPVNDVDVFAHDLGFIAIVENGELQGFNLTVGGGMGATHGDAETYPRLADVVGFLRPEQLLAVAEAVLTTQRDFGNRAVRKRARLKYTIEDRGLDWFVAEITRRQGFALEPARPFEFTTHRRPLRLDRRLRRPLAPDAAHRRRPRRRHGRGARGSRACARSPGAPRRLPPDAEPEPDHRQRRRRCARRSSMRWWCATVSTATRARRRCARDALACVALPTCALAMAEAERYLPRLVAAGRRAPGGRTAWRASRWCCASPAARTAARGRTSRRSRWSARRRVATTCSSAATARGQRLNALYLENVDEPTILAALDAAFARYARRARGG